jgi:hypothetical protein
MTIDMIPLAVNCFAFGWCLALFLTAPETNNADT